MKKIQRVEIKKAFNPWDTIWFDMNMEGNVADHLNENSKNLWCVKANSSQVIVYLVRNLCGNKVAEQFLFPMGFAAEHLKTTGFWIDLVDETPNATVLYGLQEFV